MCAEYNNKIKNLNTKKQHAKNFKINLIIPVKTIVYFILQIIWKPVKRSDIAWNFEKFLIGKDGNAVKRYSKSFQTIHISKDIETLL